jgi:mannosyltransferase
LTWTTDAPLDRRYKVFVQLLSEGGELRAQRDSEPGGGLQLTTTWAVNEPVQDNHGLLIPNDLPAAHYVLIVGLYDLNAPAARLSAAGETYLELGTITVNQP